METALSLRLGQSSNIRNAEIALPFHSNESRTIKLTRIQGKVYDQLYSPEGLSRPENERGMLAKTLAEELRDLIDMTHTEIFVR